MADCSYCQQTLPESARHCPRCGTPSETQEDETGEPEERPGTVRKPLRSSVEARHYPAARQREKRGALPSEVPTMSCNTQQPSATACEPGAEAAEEAVVFRPVFRGPLALLTLPDDDRREKGEERQQATQSWREVSPADLAKQHPLLVELTLVELMLVELTPAGEGKRSLSERKKNVIGGQAGDCHVVFSDDPFVSPVHCCLRHDEQGRRVIENHHSLNGLWRRIRSIAIDQEGEIQLGEQRFPLRILL